MKNVPTIREAIVQPTEANLTEQFGLFGVEGELDGKFVRIGNLSVFAPKSDLKIPQVKYRYPGYDQRFPNHKDIVRAALYDAKDPFCADFIAEKQRVKADNAENKLIKAIFRNDVEEGGLPTWTKLIYDIDAVVDAGTYIYDSENSTLNVFDDSLEWGAANNAGRLVTRKLIQASVGSNITVNGVPEF